MYKINFLFILCVLFLGCGGKSNTESIQMSSNVEDTIQKIVRENTQPVESDLEGYPINYDSYEVIQTLYVINREGIDIKQEPNDFSKTLKHYEYGDQVEVIGVSDDFYTIRDRIYREWQDDHATYQGSRWEKVFVEKNRLGDLAKIKLINSDLNVVCSLQGESFEQKRILDEYLQIQLVDQSLFEDKLSLKKDYLNLDSIGVETKNDKIILKISGQDIVLKDISEDDDGQIFYTYLGQYDFLNKYVIRSVGWEWWSCSLYDKTSGEKIDFGSLPYISPKQDYMLCIDFNPYESQSEVSLYKINGVNNIDIVMNATFINWQPFLEYSDENKEYEDSMFWSSDGYFYLQAIHVKSDYKNKPQYLQIKLLDVF